MGNRDGFGTAGDRDPSDPAFVDGADVMAKTDNRPVTRQTMHEVAHITFRINEYADGHETFALYPGQAADVSQRERPLFTGAIEFGMAEQLRSLAKRIDQIYAKRAMRDGEKPK